MAKQVKIPLPSLKRFSKYLLVAEKNSGSEWISTSLLSDETAYKAITIRKDIAYLGLKGIPKKGYKTNDLKSYIKSALGGDNFRDLVLIGTKGLGEAFLKYPEYLNNGYILRVAFDHIKEKAEVGTIPVYPMGKISNLIPRLGVSIALLSLDDEDIESTISLLKKHGIKGIINIGPNSLTKDYGVPLLNFNILTPLSDLTGLITS